jgi:hypothetical protein
MAVVKRAGAVSVGLVDAGVTTTAARQLQMHQLLSQAVGTLMSRATLLQRLCSFGAALELSWSCLEAVLEQPWMSCLEAVLELP